MDLGREALKIHSSDNDDILNGQSTDTPDQNGYKDNVISMAHIFRAEDNLGHTVIDPKDIENAHIGHADSVVQHLFKTIKNYSIDDTKTEQNGGPADQDLTTAGGFLKQGIQDPDAYEGRKTQKRAESDLRRISMQMEQESITKQLADLAEKISESRDKLADLEEHMKDINDIQNMIEDGADFEGDSQEARGGRRKISKILSRQGKSIEDYTDANGKIDTDRLGTDLSSATPAVTTEIQTLKEEINNLETQRQELEQQQAALIGSNQPEHKEITKELAQDISNSSARASLSSKEEDIALVQENITANNSAPDEGMGLLAFFGFEDDSETINAEEKIANNQDGAAQEINTDASTLTIANTAPENVTERSLGSFAQSNDDQSPIANIAQSISAMFSQVTNSTETPAQDTAEVTEDYTQQGLDTKQNAFTV